MNIEKLRALWDGHAQAVYAYLVRLTKSQADASDFLQDVFCRLARQPELVERLTGEPRGYLLRLAHNAVIDQVRRTQARERIFEKITVASVGEFATAEDPDRALLGRELLTALDDLPADQRFVVHARLWKMRTLDDIALELGVSINTAASRYRYGVDKMRERLRSLYEDFAPRASAKPTRPMKKNSKNPFSDPAADQPIIRPLEQRRVPSATGAAFALPVLPEHADDAVEEVPVDVEVGTEIDAEVIDPIFVVDPLPVDDSGMLVTFDDVIEGAHGDLGDPLVDEGVVEEFNPDVIFYTLFNETLDESGEVIPVDDGAIGDGEFVIDPAVDYAPVEGGPNIFHPLNDGTDHPDETGDGTATDGTIPVEKDHADGTDPATDHASGEETSAELDPNVIFYNTTSEVPPGAVSFGGGVMTSGAHTTAVDHPADHPTDHSTEEPVQTAAPATADHPTDTPAHDPAPVVHADAHDTHSTAPASTTSTPAEPASVEHTFDFQGSPIHATFTHDEPGQSVIHFEGNLAAGLGGAHGELATEHDHDFHTVDFAPVQLAFEAHAASHDSADSLTSHDATHEAAHSELTVDEWVPAHSDSSHAELIAHLDDHTTDEHADHELAVLDATDLATGHNAPLHGSALAMAATGSVLLTREAKSRKDEERA